MPYILITMTKQPDLNAYQSSYLKEYSRMISLGHSIDFANAAAQKVATPHLIVKGK